MNQEWSESEQYSYDRLMVSIDLGLGRLSLLIAACDDEVLRGRVMDRCELELSGLGVVHVVRSIPRENPSLSGMLRRMVAEKNGVADIVVSVVGFEDVVDYKELFGYLQWTREALREYPFPVLLWVPGWLIALLEERAPDFWSWRSGVFWFGVEPKNGARLFTED